MSRPFSAWVLGVAILATVAGGQDDPSSRLYLHDTWQLEDGLPQMSIRAIVQDTDGYLWLSTEEGLARFDGQSFATFGKHNNPAFQSNVVDALASLPDGTLWAATRQGLLRGKDGRFERIEGLPAEVVHALHLDADGKFWVGTDVGLAHQRADGWDVVGPEQGMIDADVRCLADDGRGGLWVGTEGGLAHLVSADGEIRRWTTEDGLAGERVEAVLPATGTKGGGVWVGTSGGLQYFTDSSFKIPAEVAELEGQWVETLHEDRLSQLWIGTRQGLYRLAGGVLYDHSDVLPHPHVAALWEDPQGNLWVGTLYGGLVRLRERMVTMIGTEQGLRNLMIWAVLEDREGNLWTTSNDGVERLSPDGGVRRWTEEDGLPASDMASLFQDEEGNVWVGAFGDGLVRIDGEGTLKVYRVEDGAPDRPIRCFLDDGEGGLWIGANSGLYRLRKRGEAESETQSETQVFERYGPEDGLPHPHVRGLHRHDGELWVLTLQGLARGRPGSHPAFQGVEADFPWRGKTLHAMADGTLWIGTYDDGLVRFRDGRYDLVTVADGLYDHRVHRILGDGEGSLWMSSNRGIFRVSIAQLDAFVNGRSSEIVSVVFDESDGMQVRECNGSGQPAGIRTRDGRLIFVTIQGLAVVDSRRITRSAVPPRVVIEQVRIDGKPVDPAGPTESDPGTRVVELFFTATTFVKPERVRFRHRLVGFNDDAWSEPTRQHSVQYTNLPPGTYRFEVVAEQHGVWNDDGDSFELRIQAAFHQTKTFWVLCVLGLAALAWGYTSRVRRYTREIDRLKSELAAKSAQLERSSPANAG